MACLVSSTFLQTLMVKYGGAVMATISSMVITPCSAFAFVSPFFMGKFAENMTPGATASLGFVVVGMGLYRYGEYRSKDAAPVTPDYLPLPKQLHTDRDGDSPVTFCLEEEEESAPPTRPGSFIGVRPGMVHSEFSKLKEPKLGVFWQHTRLDP